MLVFVLSAMALMTGWSTLFKDPNLMIYTRSTLAAQYRYFSTNALPSQPPVTATRKQKLVFYMKRYFRILYPYVNAGWYLAILGWHLRYLFGKTDYHNPLFKLMGMRMQRLGPHDTPISSPAKDLAGNTSPTRSPIAFLRTTLLPLLASSLNLILPNVDIPFKIPGMVVIIIFPSSSKNLDNTIPRHPGPSPPKP